MRTTPTDLRAIFLSLMVLMTYPLLGGVKTVPLPEIPSAVAAIGDSGHVYVAGGQSVLQVDPVTDAITKVISLPANPNYLTYDPAVKALYVPTSTSKYVYGLDAPSGQVPTVIPIEGIAGATAIDSGRQRLFVALTDQNKIKVVNMSVVPFKFESDIKLSDTAIALTYDSSTGLVYAAFADGNLLQIDATSHQVYTPHKIANKLVRMILSNSTEPQLGNRLFLTTDSALIAVDPQSLAVMSTTPLSGTPWGIAMNPATGSIFVTLVDANAVAVINGYTNSMVTSVSVVPRPKGVDVVTSNGNLTPGENKVYVTGDTAMAMSVFTDPAVGSDLITIPVRWCAMAGSVAANGITVPSGQDFVTGSAATDEILLGRLRVATAEVWIGQGAHIAFRAAQATHIPIIADPDTSVEAGTVLLGFGSRDVETAASFCEEAWNDLFPDQRGRIVVNVQNYNSQVAGTTPEPMDLIFGEPRSSALCVTPRQIVTSDVSMLDVTVADSSEFEPIIQQKGNRPGLFQSTNQNDNAIPLAHELGHSLLLGHGDGLDNNHDGVEPPTLGPRKYDGYCDPLGNDANDSPKEDLIGNPPAGCASVMVWSGTCRTLRPLQVETARDAAVLVPGAVVDNGLDPAGWILAKPTARQNQTGSRSELTFAKITLSQTPATSTTELTAKLLGRPNPAANDQFVFLLGLDESAKAGCHGSIPGLVPRFSGVGLAIRINAKSVLGKMVTTTQIQRCVAGRLTTSFSQGISSQLSGVMWSSGQAASYSTLTVILPSSIVGSALRSVSLTAASSRVGDAKPWSTLSTAERGTPITLIPPVLPVCSTSSQVAWPGRTITVAAAGLEASHAIDLFFGSQLAGTSHSDATGRLNTSVEVPSNQSPGLVQISAVEHGTSETATCSVLVVGPLKVTEPVHLPVRPSNPR